MRLADLAKNTALTLASILVSLLLAELALRAVNGQRLWPDRNFILARANMLTTNALSDFDPTVGWVLKENLALHAQDPLASFTTGELGIRMNQAAIRPTPRNAILAIGDSFTAGSEVSDMNTWPAFLERQLGQPVINAAVGGWGADQIVLRAEALMRRLSPKLVLLSLLEDDIGRTRFSVFSDALKPYYLVRDGRIELHGVPVPPPGVPREKVLGLIRRVLGYSYAVDLLMERLKFERWFQVARLVENPVDVVFITCRLVERLKSETDAAGVRLVFILQWDGTQIANTRDEPARAIEVLACARGAGIASIDTWGPLKEALAAGPEMLKSLYNMQDDGRVYSHMSPAGNRLIADLVARGLQGEANETAATPPR